MSQWIYRFVVLVIPLAHGSEASLFDGRQLVAKDLSISEHTNSPTVAREAVSNSEKHMKQMGINVKFLDDICRCEELFCKCCFMVDITQFNISQKMCLMGAFIAEDFELQASLILNNNTIGLFMLSGKNPPPICLQVPLPPPIPFPSPLAVCIRAKNIYPQNVNLHFCVDIILRFLLSDVLTLPLNCMWAGLDGILLTDQK